MADLRTHSSPSQLVRFTLKHATTGQGLTGLTFESAGLIISTIADNEATATTYTQAGGTIETIATLGTYAAPTATKCRFLEVDATNHKGLYEFQFADARWAVASAKRLIISVTGATDLLDADYEIQLVAFDPYDATALGLTSIDATISSRASQTTVDDLPNATLAEVIESEGSYTLQQAMSIIFTVLAGVTSSNGSVLKTPNGNTTRVTATLNSSQERTAMSLSPSA